MSLKPCPCVSVVTRPTLYTQVWVYDSLDPADADAGGEERLLQLLVGRDAREGRRPGAYGEVLFVEVEVDEDFAVAGVREQSLGDAVARAEHVVAGRELDDEGVGAQTAALVGRLAVRHRHARAVERRHLVADDGQRALALAAPDGHEHRVVGRVRALR